MYAIGVEYYIYSIICTALFLYNNSTSDDVTVRGRGSQYVVNVREQDIQQGDENGALYFKPYKPIQLSSKLNTTKHHYPWGPDKWNTEQKYVIIMRE